MGLRDLLHDSDALQLATSLNEFFGQADDPEAFRQDLASGNLDHAAERAGLSKEELHAQIAELRAHSEELGREYPEIADLDRDEAEEQLSAE